MIETFDNWMLAESNSMPLFLANEEIEKLYPDLHEAMRYWIAIDVLNSDEQTVRLDTEHESPEATALYDFWEEARYNSYYRIYPADGSLTIVFAISDLRLKKDFNFGWEDENGKEHTGNALDYLDEDFEIQTEFNDADPTGKISYDDIPLAVSELIAKYDLNRMTPVRWTGKKYGI